MSELDTALERFLETDCVYGVRAGGEAGVAADADEPNYGPMAASALDALGHEALTTGLLDIYVPRLSGFSPGEPLSHEAWAHHAGEPTAAPALVAGALALIDAGEPWLRVLHLAVAARLRAQRPAPDPHMTIRLAYAVSNLQREVTPVRLRELAHAAGFFLARPSADEAPTNEGVEGAIEERLSAASAAGADRYLANPSGRRAFSLGVTRPAALRVLVASLDRNDALALVESALAGSPENTDVKVEGDLAEEQTGHEDVEVERCAQDLREIRYRAACSVQEHAIVMAESCLREAEHSPDSKLRLAAADAALRLSPPGYKEWR